MIGRIFRDFFWDGMRPVRELSVCEAASRGGVKTTEIIAIVKNKILGPLYKFQLVTKEITKSIDLIELLLHSGENKLLKQKKQIINKLAKAVNDIHDLGIYHADLHLKNILVQSDAGGCLNVYIIDLDKSKQYEKISFQTRMKNIMRLDRSLEKFKRNVTEDLNILLQSQSDLSLDGQGRDLAEQITNTDKVRFLKEYLKFSDSSEQRFFRNQKKFLKYCLAKYQTTHKSHRIWWRMVNGKF
jgi:tRNA A-37 threonylcarbamoyl transferase component Bud32